MSTMCDSCESAAPWISSSDSVASGWNQLTSSECRVRYTCSQYFCGSISVLTISKCRHNALVQLQAHYPCCDEAASEQCLSAATFVRWGGRSKRSLGRDFQFRAAFFSRDHDINDPFGERNVVCDLLAVCIVVKNDDSSLVAINPNSL